jgi:hypothetical protein
MPVPTMDRPSTASSSFWLRSRNFLQLHRRGVRAVSPTTEANAATESEIDIPPFQAPQRAASTNSKQWRRRSLPTSAFFAAPLAEKSATVGYGRHSRRFSEFGGSSTRNNSAANTVVEVDKVIVEDEECKAAEVTVQSPPQPPASASRQPPPLPHSASSISTASPAAAVRNFSHLYNTSTPTINSGSTTFSIPAFPLAPSFAQATPDSKNTPRSGRKAPPPPLPLKNHHLTLDSLPSAPLSGRSYSFVPRPARRSPSSEFPPSSPGGSSGSSTPTSTFATGFNTAATSPVTPNHNLARRGSKSLKVIRLLGENPYSPQPSPSRSTFDAKSHSVAAASLASFHKTRRQFEEQWEAPRSPLAVLDSLVVSKRRHRKKGSSESLVSLGDESPLRAKSVSLRKTIGRAGTSSMAFQSHGYPNGSTGPGAYSAAGGIPVGNNPQAVLQHIMDTTAKRISTLDYLRKSYVFHHC